MGANEYHGTPHAGGPATHAGSPPIVNNRSQHQLTPLRLVTMIAL
jgi:hypothetical protein